MRRKLETTESGSDFKKMRTLFYTLLGATISCIASPRSYNAECYTSKSPFSTTEYRSYKLLSFSDETVDTRVFRFALPEADMSVQLEPPSCLLFRLKDKRNGDIVLPFTPISRFDQQGFFEIIVKRGDEDKPGKVSPIGECFFALEQGDEVDIKGPWVQTTARLQRYKTIGMIAQGTGIAPMYQVAQFILSRPKNQTEIQLLYSNREKADVLLGTNLNEMQRNYPNFSVYFTLSKATSSWMGGIGEVSKEMIRALMPPPQRAADSVILVSGPSSFMNTICGDKDSSKMPPKQGALRGCLKEMGYLPGMVYKL